jgi:hypothetical protein
MEVLAELLDDRPQIIRVLLDNPACRLQARRLGLRRFLNRAWAFWRFHVPDGRRKPNGTIALNQRAGDPWEGRPKCPWRVKYPTWSPHRPVSGSSWQKFFGPS